MAKRKVVIMGAAGRDFHNFNCLFRNNQAQGGNGGAIAAYTSTVTIEAHIDGLEDVQVQNDEPFTFQNFLSKFSTLRMFYRSPEVIHRITQEAIEGQDPGEDVAQPAIGRQFPQGGILGGERLQRQVRPLTGEKRYRSSHLVTSLSRLEDT